MFSDSDLQAIGLTLKLAATATAILLLFGTPLAWWLARSRWRYKFVLETLVALPLVLPPTVLGFYLLLALAPNGPVGAAVNALGGPSLVFSFYGLVIGSVIYSLPFVVQPLQDAFARIGNAPFDAAASLGAGPVRRFVQVALPMARSGLITAAVLGFTHTVGEFGVVLMLGGNIPGATQVLSISIYDHVEALDYASAHRLAGGLLIGSFLMLLLIYRRRLQRALISA